MKYHNLELGRDLLAQIQPANGANAAVLEKYDAELARYDRESSEAQDQAREKEAEVHRAERRALRYDIGEGLFEVGVVVTSLYFISLRLLFPAIGLAAGTGATGASRRVCGLREGAVQVAAPGAPAIEIPL
jgi:hypothetical protein